MNSCSKHGNTQASKRKYTEVLGVLAVTLGRGFYGKNKYIYTHNIILIKGHPWIIPHRGHHEKF